MTLAVGAPLRSTEHRFRAMNTDVHVVVVGGDRRATAKAEALVHRCEQRWSRFRPDSELSALNAAAGRPVRVSDPTFELVRSAVDAARETGGAFDPTVLASLLDAGYDRTFDDLVSDPAPAVASSLDPEPEADRRPRPGARVSAPGVADIELLPEANLVRLPPDVGLDLGGIAKGATADLVVAELLDAGVEGACVNIGGDLRVAGSGPDRGTWTVDLVGRGSADHQPIRLAAGAVCTSSTLKRRWRHRGRDEHHLRHGPTGAPLARGLVTASIVAATATQAEVLTKVVLAAGPTGATATADRYGVTGIVVDDDGRLHHLPGLDPYLDPHLDLDVDLDVDPHAGDGR